MKNKNILFTIIIVVSFLLLIIISFTINDNKQELLSDDQNVILANAEQESSSINSKKMKQHIEINIDTFFKYYNKNKEKIILFARPSCHYCEIAEPIIKNLAYEYNLNIYAINTETITEEEKNKLLETNDFFKSLGTPTLIIVKNGTILDSINGLTDRAHYKKLLKDNNYIK